ncbi:MAG: hypothetical protein U0996_11245 [Planctomycetaceae bacterium]
MGSSLHPFRQLRNRSQAMSRRTRLFGRLLEQMAEMMRSVCRPAWRLTQGEGNVGTKTMPSIEKSLNSFTIEREIDIADNPVRPIELAGTSRWMSLHTEHLPPSNQPSITNLPVSKDSGSGHHVVWWNGESVAIPVAASDGFRMTERRFKTASGRLGPAHSWFDVSSASPRDVIEAETLALGYELRFRYFDGERWREAWDSHLSNNFSGC